MEKLDYGRADGRFNIFNFEAPGPVGAAFINSTGPFDFIRGPWGSGKTVAAVFKIVRHAGMDFCVCRDSSPKYPHGVVHARVAAIRDTYREMAKTALASWHEFFPKNGPFTRLPIKANYTGGSDRPVLHGLEWEVIRKVPGPRGIWIDAKIPIILDMEFGAIGTSNLDSFFKGYEITAGWINEADLCEPSVPGRLYGRTARYPPRMEIQPWEAERCGTEIDPDTGKEDIKVPRIILGDFNPPDESNWTYEREIEDPQSWPGYNFFAQPSGLSPDAENRLGKTRSAYVEEEQAFGGPKHPDSLRNVHGQYAARADRGTPVFAGKFDLQKHRSDVNLDPIPGLPIYLGVDGGGSPACGIAQFMPTGQARLLREIVTFPITGPTRFAEEINRVLLQDFAGYPVAGAWGDPSNWFGADKINSEFSFMETVMNALGVMFVPTINNDPSARIEAVSMQLKEIDVNTPGLLCDPRLKYTIRGFVSQYHLTKSASESATSRLVVDKNEFSHIHDAWQYLFYGYRGGAIAQGAAGTVRGRNIVSLSQARKVKPPVKSIWDA
ncbi:MAG: hypothetical protein JKY94_10040 [Rhodobacteraceae bacterium]|nr:hypothetical protein [Paracoccaceae bacterium]